MVAEEVCVELPLSYAQPRWVRVSAERVDLDCGATCPAAQSNLNCADGNWIREHRGPRSERAGTMCEKQTAW